ncbi:MAG: FAD-binding oxidoreductase [Nostocoides sp.]
MSGSRAGLFVTAQEHAAAVRGLTAAYAAIPPGEPVRLAKRTSNLFRPRAATARPGLDVAALNRVVAVDATARTARVQGMTTYEDLVDATLPHGLMPLVVPQLKTITLGGAVTGLGIEASSFRNGLPHESVLSMEILTGSGEVVVAAPEGEHADLFHAFPNSYGSLGYALSLTIELEPVRPWVALRHKRFGSITDATAAISEVMATRSYAGEPVDFVDGVVFTGTEVYLTLAAWLGVLPPDTTPSDYTGQQIFYTSIQTRASDVLSVRDFLWRWDTDWFWCSRAFGAQNPRIRRVWPKRYLRSDVYWKMIRFENAHHWAAKRDARRGEPPRERVVQDVEIPVGALVQFIEWFLAEVPIEPIWLCPIQLRDNGVGQPDTAATDPVPWPLYPMHRGAAYVNVGFWSTVPILPGRADGDVNRAIEEAVTGLGGHKSLYSDAFYDKATFDALYGGAAYDVVKKSYDPDGRLPSLYDKAVRAR